eukprot:2528951-Karenia_brevis.AAC.1
MPDVTNATAHAACDLLRLPVNMNIRADIDHAASVCHTIDACRLWSTTAGIASSVKASICELNACLGCLSIMPRTPLHIHQLLSKVHNTDGYVLTCEDKDTSVLWMQLPQPMLSRWLHHLLADS